MDGDKTYSSLQLNQLNWLLIYRALIIAASLAKGEQAERIFKLAEMIATSILRVCDRKISIEEKNV